VISFASTRDIIIPQADTFRFPVDVHSLNIEIRAFFSNLVSGGGRHLYGPGHYHQKNDTT
jgi:hypothetical protein